MEVFLAPTCFVPGFNSILHAYYYNAGTVTTTTTLKIVLDDSINFVSSAPAPSSISGDTLFYSIGPVYYDSIGMVDIQLHTPATLSLGTMLTFIAGVPSAGDIYPEDNADTLQSIVIGAFDPNDKAVNQPYYIDGTEEMVYKIQFQNTGTLAATNVVVTDTLDSDLNFSTFKLLSASHPVNVKFSIGSKIDFEFMNIQLPDSTSDEVGSHGEIVYSIKMNTGLAIGTTIKNKAFIYFDYNAPIITNTTVNKIGVSPVGINESVQTSLDFNLYPNPAKEELLIVSQSKIQRLEIFDITGRKILEQTVNGLGKIQLTITGIESGIYIVRIITDKGNSSKKLVINR